MTNEQRYLAVVNSPAAMDIIIGRAKEKIAKDNNTTVENVALAFSVGNENVLKDLAKLVALGIKAATEVIEEQELKEQELKD